MLSDRIRQLLIANSKNASDLARYVDVTPQAAAKWLSGAEPRPKVKEKIARFFGLTPQELEYGNLLALSSPRPEATKINATLSRTLAEHTADSMIDQELKHSGAKSPEYIEGMRNFLLFRLSGIHIPSSYRPGTCQADAYEAGYAHGRILLEASNSL